MDRNSSFTSQSYSGCESTLNQILRILSQDGNISLNSQDKDTLIKCIRENTDRGTKEDGLTGRSRKRAITHTERLQQTEVTMGWNLTDDEDAPILTPTKDKNRRHKAYDTFSSSKRQKGLPKDHYYITYIAFCLMGMATMLPWNFFTALNTFWNYRFRDISYQQNITQYNPTGRNQINQSSAPQTDLQKEFTSFLSIASNIPNAIFVILNALYGFKFSSNKRINLSNLSMIFLFMAVTGLAATNSDEWQDTFLYLVLTLVILISASASIYTGSIFGLAGKFPPKYMGGAMLGQAVGGLLPAIAVIMILAFDIEAKNVGLACFLIAVGFLILGMVSYNNARKAAFFKYYSHSSTRKTSQTREISDLSESNNNNQNEKWKAPPDTKLLDLLKKSKIYSLAIFFTSCFTLSVFPSLTVLVEHYQTKTNTDLTKWEALYFTPVSNFLVCGIGDSFGRILANNFQLSKKPKIRELLALILAISRATFIPIFLLCNASPSTRTLPVVFTNDALFILFMSLLSLGNGYLGNLCMLNGPKKESDDNGDAQEKIAMILVAFLVLGQAFGSFASYFILQLL